MPNSLTDLLNRRVLVADGAMGTMLQSFGELSIEDDFLGLEGCNEILNVTRPDVVAAVHRAYFEAGSDAVETNTFGTNLAALGEYDIVDRLEELAEAGARVARTVADEFATDEHPRFVLGSMGPGTKLPTLGHIGFAAVRDAYQAQVEAMIRGGIDAVQIETCQDLLQAKAAVIAAKRAREKAGVELPIMVNVTVETTGTMLLGSEIGAALTTLQALGIDCIGLNCATGPAEMSEHLRHLARRAGIAVGAMPNAGLPELTADGARYPLSPEGLADALGQYLGEFGLAVIGGCCGTTPEHIRLLAERFSGQEVVAREVEDERASSSLYIEVPFEQDASYLSIGERTNANGSKAFRDSMLAGNWDECVDIAKAQARDGAHILDLCIDYVGRDGAADMSELAFRLSTAVTLPIVLDSTEPHVLLAGLERLAGRSIINSVNYEDGDGPESRFAKVMPLVKEHGAAVVALTIDEEGQARTAEWKVRVASRLVDDLVGNWGMDVGDILVDCLTFPIATGQEETRRDGLETIEAIRELKRRYPGVRTTLGVSNVSFGLNPAARIVLNSVFLHECVQVGLDSAIVHSAKILPMDRIPEEQRKVALDLVYDRRDGDYDPLVRYLELFEGVTAASAKATRAAELAALPLAERLRRRIIDGEGKGLDADLEEALKTKAALEIINEDLLAGMKTVGELFGSGQMQLPFVLQSAEVMKTAVAYLEPHMEKAEGDSGKGTLVLATVRGDVHDIGKNLVDIIVSNNGYTVINIGIKQPINAIVEAAEAHKADAIGMSGLLVKSTLVMKDNLVELNRLGLADKYPVMLGGAALTRAYVEHDLGDLFEGEVRYAKDAFEGLALMDAVMAVKQGLPGAKLPEPKKRRYPKVEVVDEVDQDSLPRSDVQRRVEVPTPPFWGSRVVKGIALAEIVEWLDHRATFMGRWGMRAIKGGPSYEELVKTEALPRLRMWLDRIKTEQIGGFAVVHGYWPAYSEGRDLVIGDPDDWTRELTRFTFPRQRRDRHLSIPDFFRDRAEAEELGPDVFACQVVTMGSEVAGATQKLFEANAYRDYLELHGLSVQLTEALAEFWHHRTRLELGFGAQEGTVSEAIRDQAYRGSRYSFGYPACPDLEDRVKLMGLLEPGRIGVELSEELQLHPEQSTDAFILHHPEAKYFNAG
ncbi:methionine synthase (B12-dependent) [Tessaracoccus bendigoensis DSM 12906]|uniref:Methionine synthase n=1 Tax=Tessaracoccus bendigoensis DSM 12906 TaxID=1123357 RepID=A0A1M6IRJ5_9ACTN|nr:methionine synthase [Tessaracoccus bendigoensis]SHJ37054.1 methionine synthase (B12-dependent) [Tessaracoccus bendigoensis DSM 12906]